jgi:hypothetical protein
MIESGVEYLGLTELLCLVGEPQRMPVSTPPLGMAVDHLQTRMAVAVELTGMVGIAVVDIVVADKEGVNIAVVDIVVDMMVVGMVVVGMGDIVAGTLIGLERGNKNKT